MKRVLVTGATGFLGKRLVRSLVRDGIHVRCLVRDNSDVASLQSFLSPEQASLLEIQNGEMTDTASLQKALAECDVVYHCAASMKGTLATMLRENVEPVRLLAQAVLAAKVPRLVHVSSMGVYGAGALPVDAVLDEQCPLEPKPSLRDNYTQSKLAQEELLWQLHRDQQLPVVFVRPGVIIGPGRGALSPRLGLSLGKLQLRFGDRILPYTYVDNCADAIKQAGLVADVIGQAFNIVDDQLPRASEVIAAYRQHQRQVKTLTLPQWSVKPLSMVITGLHRVTLRKLPLVLSPYRSAAFYKPLRFTGELAKKKLHWQPVVPMQEALRRSILGVES